MRHTFTLEIPDEIYEPLLRLAKQTGRTPEEVITEWLASAIQRFNQDPLLQLAGAFASDVTDVSDRHDNYIGQGLVRKLRGDDND